MTLRSISEFVQHRWGSWGLPIFSLWAIVLAFLAVARLLLLSRAVEFASGSYGDQSLIWFIFILNIILAVGFGASAYGLWGRRRWGRVLFLWLIVIWSVSNLAALFVFSPPDQDLTIRAVIVNGFRFAIGALISLWYFNIPHVKALFYPDPLR